MPIPLYSLVSLILLGLIPTLIKATAASIPTIGLARLVVAIAAYALFSMICQQRIVYRRKDLLPCAAIGIAFGLHWLCYFYSIRLSTVAIASLCMATSGLMMVFLARLYQHESVKLRDVLSLALAIVGSILVLPDFNMNGKPLWGFILGLLNAFLFALAATLQRSYADKIPNSTRTFSQYLFALPVFILLWPQTKWNLTHKDWGMLLVLGFFCTFIAHTLWIKTLEILPAKKAAVLYYLSTFFAIALSVAFLGEIPEIRTIAGGALIIVANYLILRERSESSSGLAPLKND